MRTRPSLNQKDIKTKLMGHQQVYQVDAKEHVLGVRYHALFEHHDHSHDILKSDVVLIQTPQLQNGQTYHLALIDAPQEFDAAQKYKNQPIVGLYDANRQLLVQKTGITLRNTSGNALDLTQQSKPKPIFSIDSVKHKNMLAHQEEPQLIKTWQNSSQLERQRFMMWLADQGDLK